MTSLTQTIQARIDEQKDFVAKSSIHSFRHVDAQDSLEILEALLRAVEALELIEFEINDDGILTALNVCVEAQSEISEMLGAKG